MIDVPKFFGNDFPIVNLLKNLTYFDDGDLHRLSKKERNFLIEVVNTISLNEYSRKKQRWNGYFMRKNHRRKPKYLRWFFKGRQRMVKDYVLLA